MKHEVILKLFEDDATGQFGLAHRNAIDINTPFNAFWDGRGIFHDVFEHYFEDKHKYFTGNGAFNLGGEIAAMGHLAYYVQRVGLGSIRSFNNSRYIDDDVIIRTTHSDIQEASMYGYTNYGDKLICKVPPQAYRKDEHMLESMIDEHIARLDDLPVRADYPDEIAYAINFRKSVTPEKLRRLYRWGFKQAERLVPYEQRYENYEVLEKFIKYWNNFTKDVNAEALSNYYDLLRFRVKTVNKIVFWQAHFRTSDSHAWIQPDEVLDIYAGI